MVQRRRTRAQWEQLVEGWRRSGLTQQAYCERQGISLSRLQHWHRCLREMESPSSGVASATVRLVPIDWVDSEPRIPSLAAGLTLVLRAGMRLEVTPDFDGPTLQRLLALLREAA